MSIFLFIKTHSIIIEYLDLMPICHMLLWSLYLTTTYNPKKASLKLLM